MSIVERIDPVLTTLFGLTCFSLGILVGFLPRWLRRRAVAPAIRDVVLTSDTEAAIDARSRSFAEQRGTPDVAPWVASSVKDTTLGYLDLQRRFGTRRGGKQ